MSTEPQFVRLCKDCPEWTHIVCCFAFAAYWDIKSCCGTGCDCPIDEVAEAWRKAGWKPGEGVKARLMISFDAHGRKTVRKMQQTNLFSSSSKPKQPLAELPPLSDDDY